MNKQNMTVLQMQKKLQEMGYSVSLIFRKEGGARITKIDTESFKGSAGNVRAREILGVNLTEAQTRHLKRIKQKKGVFGKKRVEPLDPELIRLQNKINRGFKDIGQSARVTRKKIRYRLENDGYEETKKYLERVLRYTKDYAYDESIEALIMRLANDYAVSDNNSKILEIIDMLKAVLQQQKLIFETTFEEMLFITYQMGEGAISIDYWHAVMVKYIAKAE